jgi:hypothetical protein
MLISHSALMPLGWMASVGTNTRPPPNGTGAVGTMTIW